MRVNICVNDLNKKLQRTKKCVIRRKLRVKNYDKYLEGKQFGKYTEKRNIIEEDSLT